MGEDDQKYKGLPYHCLKMMVMMMMMVMIIGSLLSKVSSHICRLMGTFSPSTL